MAEQFLAAINSLTNIDERAQVTKHLMGLPRDKLVSVRGELDTKAHTVEFRITWTMTPAAYTRYQHQGGEMLFIPVTAYLEINGCLRKR